MYYIGFYLPYLSYVFILPYTAVFTLDSSMDVTTCTLVSLVEIYGHVLLCTPVPSVEVYMHALTGYSVHLASVHAITLYVLLKAYLLVLTRVCVSRARASARTCERTSIRICACGGCSLCTSIFLSNILLWGDLVHGSRTAYVYIRGALGDSLYHIP